MHHVLSTQVVLNHRLTVSTLDKIQRAGIPAVEIFCARQHLDYLDKAQVRELGHWFRDADLKLHSMHSPMFNDDCNGRSGPGSAMNITETAKARRIAVVDEIKRALEVAETIPFRYLIQHLGGPGEEYDEHKLDAAFSSLEEIKIFAHQRGAEVLLENIPNALSSAERLMLFLGQTHLHMNFCFDAGHAHLGEGIAAAYEVMAPRIRSTHLHDNDGQHDAHLFPLSGGGSIDWTATMRLLKSLPDQYALVLEVKESPNMPHPFDAASEIFEKLEELQ